MSNSLLKAELSKSLRAFLELDLLLTEADTSLSSYSSSSSSSTTTSNSINPPIYPPSCPTNEKLFGLLNRIQDGLGRLEAAAEDPTTRGTLEPALLSFLGDNELNNPDAWLQQRLGEIVQDEKVSLVRSAALQSVSETLRNFGKTVSESDKVRSIQESSVQESCIEESSVQESSTSIYTNSVKDSSFNNNSDNPNPSTNKDSMDLEDKLMDQEEEWEDT